MNGVQDQTDVHEAAWPETMARVGNRCAQANSSSRILDCIAEKGQLTDHRRVRFVWQTNFGSKFIRPHLLLNFRQTVLRDSEVRIDWVQPLDYQQSILGWRRTASGSAVCRRTAGVNNIANISQALTGASVNR